MVEYYKLDIIPIILNIFNVNDVVLCGVLDEKTHNQVMFYCDENDASCRVIDLQEIQSDSANNSPLNILPNLNDFDAIFLNDDPNWYTVFKELNIIKESNNEFPLVFICHNIFPHKRRDSYVNPKRIPKDFLNDYSKDLMIHDEVVIHDEFFHAIEENTPKNGVLTAIEDFLNQNSSIGLADIKFFNGITILYHKDNISKIRWRKVSEEIEGYEWSEDFSDHIVENQILSNHIAKFKMQGDDLNVIEDLESEIREQEKLIDNLENQVSIQGTELNLKNSQIDNFDSKLDLKDIQLKNAESKLFNRDAEIKHLNDKISSKDIELNSLKNTESKLNSKISSYTSQIDALKSNILQLGEKESELNNQLKIAETNLKEQLNHKDGEISLKNNQIKEKEQEINEKNQKLHFFNQQHINQMSKLDSMEYCISCYQEEIANNHSEIEYLKRDSLIRKLFAPIAYVYLIFKSSPKELSLNFKLYNAMKNSKCFDIGFYLNNNKDIQESNWCKYFSPELHYVCNGFNENRNFNKKYFNRNSKKELLEYILNCKYYE